MNGGHIFIVGAGIAGLTLAIALERSGIASTLIEQVPEFGTVGAGLQLSPNATRILDRLGLSSDLHSEWYEPPRVSLVDGRTLRQIAHVPMGVDARARWGAPYAVLHRADLQRVLVRAAKQSDRIDLVQGVRVGDVDELAVVTGRRSTSEDIVVAADGVWSALRASASGKEAAKFTGFSAWRMRVSYENFGVVADPEPVTAFLAASAHLVAYPLPRHEMINLVAIGKGGGAARRWSGGAQDQIRNEIRLLLQKWHPSMYELAAGADMLGRWPIFTLSQSAWQCGRAILIGDAAHAMAPFAAQGAAMAIEDGHVLAACIARHRHAPEMIAARFRALREGRIARVRQRAELNRLAYHAAGPVRIARDMVLGFRRPSALAADFDWLYGGNEEPL